LARLSRKAYSCGEEDEGDGDSAKRLDLPSLPDDRMRNPNRLMRVIDRNPVIYT